MGGEAREPKPLHPILASAVGPALIKHLASCNATVRSQSLRLLQSWLVSESSPSLSPPQLSDGDMKRIWKGLFYCLWHSDKTPNQVALIDRLTSLFLSLPPSLSLDYFRGFLVTLRREWPGIDRLRLDKFYLTIRRFMRALFELMRLRNWKSNVLGEYFRVLEFDGFLAEDKLQGSGVNYHIVSVFLEELKGVGFPATAEVVDVILKPFLEVMMRGKDKILVGKVKSCVFDELANAGKDLLEKKKMGVDCDENVFLLGVVALRMGLAGRLYQVGSSTNCIQGNRKVVFALHDVFLKLEKELETSGFEIGVPEYCNVSDDAGDEVPPQLIPIDFGAGEGRSGVDDPEEEALRKCKKVKREKDGDDKKRKKNKKKKEKNVEAHSEVSKENGVGVDNGCDDDPVDDHESNGIDESMISNLQRQFEKVATEMESERARSKRKRRTEKQKQKLKEKASDVGSESVGKSSSSSAAKKVRFSMKNNLVWKPQNPLPPESLRLPPSVTPRGSALKKGVPPGPVVEIPKKIKTKKKKVVSQLKSAKLLVKRRLK
ncbi:uncharacterized protein LOC127263515 [Andrographis paniculata]|uniref:uncharacterized protein LOC127263515 n=1 Tax=Andrographis paniculata TaxID=175694 RepID=UPI0021E7BF00|nr:uncharacterized protein LOC127263515 [Andrographis paniculata]